MEYIIILLKLVFFITLHDNYHTIVESTDSSGNGTNSDDYVKETARELGRPNLKRGPSLSGRKYTNFDNQLGGHHNIKEDTDEGYLLKPVLEPLEISFYQDVQQTSDTELKEVKQFLTEYGGTVDLKSEDNKNVTHIRLKNITENFVNPCTMDIKMGFQIWDPNSSKSKIEKQQITYVAMRQKFHFCIMGFKYTNVATGKVEIGIKANIKLMTPEEAIEILFNFVNGDLGFKSGVVRKIIEQLSKIASWFEHQNQYKFYGSSVLLTYDAEDLVTENDPKVSVRMIDFNHAYHNTQRDRNYFSGLQRLIDVFENLKTLHDNPGLLSSYNSDLKDLQKDDGFVLIPCLSEQEYIFYEGMKNNIGDPKVKELSEFLAEYGGTIELNSGNISNKYLRIKMPTHGYAYPCYVRIRMGHQLRPPPIFEHEGQIYQTMRNHFHFLIQAFNYIDITTYEFEEDEETELMSPEEGIRTLFNFVNRELGMKAGVVRKILERLEKMALWFEEETRFKFYSSSLIIAYDAENLKSNTEPVVQVRMIDFKHTSPSDKKDENYLDALQRLIEVFKNLDALHKNPKLIDSMFPTS